MYYGFILLSVVMFGGCFMLNDVHRRLRSSCLKVSLQGSLFSALTGLLVLLIVNGFSLTLTWGSVLISLLAAINTVVLSYCGIMALGSINLSLYSLLMMLGGMMLPFWQGVFFYGEKLTVAKVICFVLICVALLVTIEKGESKKKAVIYYVAIFVLNGMSGVYSKIFVVNTIYATLWQRNLLTYGGNETVFAVKIRGVHANFRRTCRREVFFRQIVACNISNYK